MMAIRPRWGMHTWAGLVFPWIAMYQTSVFIVSGIVIFAYTLVGKGLSGLKGGAAMVCSFQDGVALMPLLRFCDSLSSGLSIHRVMLTRQPFKQLNVFM